MFSYFFREWGLPPQITLILFYMILTHCSSLHELYYWHDNTPAIIRQVSQNVTVLPSKRYYSITTALPTALPS